MKQSFPKTPSGTALIETPEAHVRRAFGAGASSGRVGMMQQSPDRSRHRFVSDGDVPVFVVPRRNPSGSMPLLSPAGVPSPTALAEVTAALNTERRAREQAEAALQHARALIQSLQTKLAHAEIGHAETLAAERKAREAAEHILEETLAAQQRTEQPQSESSIPKQRKRRSRVALSKEPEQEPVQWWIPGWRDQFDRR